MDIFTTPLAGFFFHLFIVLVLGLTILLALVLRRTQRLETRRRTWAGLLALLAFQAILLLAGGWGSVGPGALERTAVGDLERAVSLASALVIGWILLAPRRTRLADVLFPGLVLLTGVLAIVFTFLLASTIAIIPDLNFNATILAPTWEVLRALALLAMTIVLGIRRPASWGTAAATLALLLLGAVLQFLVGSSSGDLAEYTRLTELVAYPLLAYQVTSRLRREATASGGAPEVAPSAAGAIGLPPVSRKPFPILEPGGKETERAAWAAGWICQVAEAQAALLLTWDPESAELRSPGGWECQNSSALPELSQEVAQGEFLSTAFQDGKSVRWSGGEIPTEVHALLERAGLGEPGSALLLPLPTGDIQRSAVLLVRSRGSVPWSQEDQDGFEWLAVPLSLVLQPAGQAPLSGAGPTPSRTTSVLGAAEADHLRTRVAELEAELQRSAPVTVGAVPAAPEEVTGAGEGEAGAAWASVASEAARLEENLLHAIADREDRVNKLQEALLAAEAVVSAAQLSPRGPHEKESDETAALRLALERAEKELAEKRGEGVAASSGSWEVSGLPVVDRELVAALIKELHHPMSLAVSYADHLLLDAGRKDGGLGKKTLERVRASLARTNTLVQALEKVALIHDKDVPVEKGPFSVEELLESCLGSSRDIIQEKGLLIRMEVSEDLSSVYLDAGILQQVAEHLIHNAALATPAHQAVDIRAVTVSVEGSSRPSLLISIHDGGPGIASEDFPRVFDRVSRTTGQPIEGLGDLGVGLAVANILVQRTGGRLWLESAPSQGTTFQALFPLEGG